MSVEIAERLFGELSLKVMDEVSKWHKDIESDPMTPQPPSYKFNVFMAVDKEEEFTETGRNRNALWGFTTVRYWWNDLLLLIPEAAEWLRGEGISVPESFGKAAQQ